MYGFEKLERRDKRRAKPGERKAYQVKNLWSRHNEMLRLKLLGVSNKKIGEILGIRREYVSQVVNSDIAKAKLSVMEGARDAETLDVAIEIKRMIPKALKIYEEILNDEEGRVSMTLKKNTADTIVKDLGGYEAPKKVAVGHFSVEEIEAIKSRGKVLAKSKFAQLLTILISYIYSCGYEITLGDAWAKSGHIDGSFHYKRLAVDLNLFKDGVYLRSSKDHKRFGEFWKNLHPLCSWGGDFRNKDGNHYSFGEKR